MWGLADKNIISVRKGSHYNTEEVTFYPRLLFQCLLYENAHAGWLKWYLEVATESLDEEDVSWNNRGMVFSFLQNRA